jgi:hypothetical protein
VALVGLVVRLDVGVLVTGSLDGPIVGRGVGDLVFDVLVGLLVGVLVTGFLEGPLAVPDVGCLYSERELGHSSGLTSATLQ